MPPFRFAIGRKAVLWLLPPAFIYGMLSAISWPTSYVTSHMIIDYHFGFGKRGLIGTVIRLIDRPPYHFATLAWMAFAVFAIWFTLLVIAAWRQIRIDTGISVAFLLFFLSAGFASLVCDVGRGEHFGLLLGLPCLFLPARLIWLPLRAALLIAAVLAQEVNFLFVGPFAAFDVWAGTCPRTNYRPVIYAAATVLPAALLTSYLGNVQTACNSGAAITYFQHLVVDFRVQPLPVATLCMDGAANMRLASRILGSFDTGGTTIPLTLIVALPSMLFNISLTARILDRGIIAVAACVATALAPLALIGFGFDVVRFATMIQVTSLVMLISAARRFGLPEKGALPYAPSRAAIVIVLAAYQLGTSVTLEDGSQILKFPFTPLIARAVMVAQGRAPFMVIR